MIAMNTVEGTCQVAISYREKHYFVTFIPNPNKIEFESTRFQHGNGRTVKDSNLCAVLDPLAQREIYTRLKQQWKRGRNNFNVAERIEIAHVFKFAQWTQQGKQIPFDPADVYILQECGRSMKEKVILWKEAARKTHHQMGNCFNHAKKEVLVDIRKRHELTNIKRNFFDAVLGQAFSWNNTTVPAEAIEIAKFLLPKNAMVLQKL